MINRKINLTLTAIVLLHALISTLHGLGHTQIPVPLSLPDLLFVVFVIGLAPLVGLAMIWTRYPKAGLWIVLLSMIGAFVFGVYHHFVELGTDNVNLISAGDWRPLFQITAVLLAIIEAASCVFAVIANRASSARKGAV